MEEQSTLPADAQVGQPPSFWQGWGNLLDRTFKYWAMLPMILILVVLTLQPALQLLQMSVSNVEFVEGQLEWTYVGAEHFQDMLADPIVPDAFRNTFIFVAVVVIVETTLGLILALAVSRAVRLVSFFRAVYVIPILIPPIAIGTMWRLMYDYNYGVINQLLALVGIAGPTWTADPNLALISIMLVDIWHWTSFLFLILLAGVESLPQELMEAARVDGASELQIYRHVMLPLLRPTIIVALMLRTIFAFKVFDQIFLLTNGGPGTHTEVISLYIYKVFFVQFRLGYGAFLALVTALIVSLLVIFYQWLNAMVRRSM